VRPLIAWLLLAIGVIFIPFDLAFSDGHRPTGLSLLALILIGVGLHLHNVFTKAFWIAEAPRGADLSSLDRLQWDGLTDWDRDEAARARDLDEYLDNREEQR
jgi:hypothetical protein